MGAAAGCGRVVHLAGSWFLLHDPGFFCHVQPVGEFRHTRWTTAAIQGEFMIVLSVGMPRAGSGWHYNLIHDLMKTTGCADAHDIREKYRLQKILTEVNCNIGVLSARRLGMVSIPALLGKTFVIKAHAGPTTTSRLLSALGLLRITYIYRDPRDAMLSAFDFGRRALAKGQPNAFSHLSDFEKCVNFMMQYVHIWQKWVHEKNVLIA